MPNSPTAVVRAIAVVGFGLEVDARGPCHLIDCRLTVDEQIERGRTVSADTQAFWAKQEPLGMLMHYGVMQHPDTVFTVAGDVKHLLQALDDACACAGPATRVWRRGFLDTQVLGHLLAADGRDTPWSYKLVRDVRTLDEIMPPPRPGYPHQPMSDCLAQIQHVRQALGRVERPSE